LSKNAEQQVAVELFLQPLAPHRRENLHQQRPTLRRQLPAFDPRDHAADKCASNRKSVWLHPIMEKASCSLHLLRQGNVGMPEKAVFS
jgi:hypothetical protein